MMSLEEVPEDRELELDLPKMADVRAWMVSMQRSMDKIEESLLSQNEVMEEVRSKVSLLANTRKNSRPQQPVMSNPSSSFRGPFTSHTSDLQVSRFASVSMDEMPRLASMPGQPETRGSIPPNTDPSVDSLMDNKPHYSTKSLGFANFQRKDKKGGSMASMNRCQSEPELPPSSPSGFEQQRRNFLRSKTKHATQSQYGAMGELEAATARLLQKDRRRSTQKSDRGSYHARAGSKEASNHSGSGDPIDRRVSSRDPIDRRGSSPGPIASRNLDRILPEHTIPETAGIQSSVSADDQESEVKFGESEVEEEEEEDESHEKVDHFPSSRKRILVRCRRISLEELRDNYDSELVNRQGGNNRENTHHWRDETSLKDWLSDDELSEPPSGTALTASARVLLAMVGILDYKDGLLWRVLSFFSLLVPVILSVSSTVTTTMAGADLRVFNTYICYFAGSLLASVSLRRAGITSLLGPVDHRLDLYADESGFLEDWQRISAWRLAEVMGLYAVMVSFRVIASFITSDVSYGQAITGNVLDILPGLAFSLMALRLVMVCFTQLHICCGLELAIDSFGLRVFRDMDMEKALEEWNLVQATLRQCSGKLSSSMSIMGICCFACLMFLAEQLLNSPDLLQNLLDSALWMGWLYPPVVLFAYTMMRAAAVSEKASRVAPLVNSWKFEKRNAKQKAMLMDHDRQYVVQYIIQSEAGFYLKGVRLTAGSVQKMSYYFAAFTFSVFARFWGASAS